MNARSYKTVFSKRLGTLVAVGEHATSQGKANGAGSGGGAGASATLGYIAALTAGFAFVSLAWAAPANNALPTSGTVVQGAASMAQSANQLNITQSTQRAAINWQSFDIGSQARVQVYQPNAQSVLLNRVVGNTPSQIFGHMQANGHVILVNPNGVMFGKDGSVNAGGFTASTLNISDANFMAGNMVYERNGSTAGIVNQGNITAAPGGYVALLGATVSNEGSITTKGGSVVMGAGETIKVPVSGTGRIKLELTPAAINASVSNSGSIVTEGGQVYMQALALNRAAAQILQSGSIDTTGEKGGDVHVLADGGSIKVDGSITANSTVAGNKGGDIVIGRDEVTGVLAKSTDVSGALLESKSGFVETSGHDLKIDGAQVKAANWLLDPDNIEITNGTATAGYSTISASTLSGALTSGTTVTVNTTAGAGVTAVTGASASGSTGNIKVTDAITKSTAGNATLNLIADDSIELGNNITSTAGQLNINLTAGKTISGSGNLSANGGNITLTSGDTTNFGILSGAITAAQVTKAGAGLIRQMGTLRTPTMKVTEGTWEIGNGTTNGSVALASGSSAVGFETATGATLSYNVATGTTFDSVSSIYRGGGTLQKEGAGTLQWGVGSGTFEMSSGSLIDVKNGTFVGGNNKGEVWTNNMSSLNVAANASFVGAESDVRVNVLTGNGSVSTGWNSLGSFTMGVGNTTTGTATFAGTLSSTGGSGLVKTGSYTQSLTNNSIFTGNTTVNGGTLQIGGGGNAGTLGTGNVTLANGANLSYLRNVTTTISNAISGEGNVTAHITGGDLTVSKTINLSGGGNIYLKTTNGKMTTSAAMAGTNIILDNTAGTIDATTGAIIQGSGSSTGTEGISLGGALTATSNVNILGVNKTSGTGSTSNGVGVDLKSSAAITAQNISITGASDNSFGIQQSTGALNATGAITLNGTSKNWVGVVTGGAVNAGGALSITGKKTTNSGSQGVNIASAVKGASVNITGESVNHWGVGIGGAATVTATSGAVNITGTSGTSDAVSVGQNTSRTGAKISAVGDINLIGTAGKSSAGQSGITGVRIWDGGIISSSNGSLNIAGTVDTLNGQSGNGVEFNRPMLAAQLTAKKDISIIGTVTGYGGGSGVNTVAQNQSGQAPMMDAGGKFTLRGNNRAASGTGNASAAISGTLGLQVTAIGDIVIQAETQNAAVNAISFSSSAFAQSGNASFKSTGGNVLIQANQGAINFSNGLATSGVTTAPYTSSTDISGKNITIDNTGAGMAIGAGTTWTGSGGTQGASIANGGSISSTGVIGKGSGTSTYASGGAITFNSSAGLAIAASENVNIAAVNNGATQSGLYTSGATTISGKNVTIDGTSLNSNGVITYGTITANSLDSNNGNVTIVGTSTGAPISPLPQTASALSLQGVITAYNNVSIVGNNTNASNGAAVASLNKAVTATNGKIDITTSTLGTTANALQLLSTAVLSAKTEVNLKTDTLSIDTAGAFISATMSGSATPTGTISIKTDSPAAKIDIGAGDAGSATPGSRTLGLTNAELNRITAGNLVIGDASNTGGITVSAATTTNATTGNVTLQTGGNIAVNAALTVGDAAATKNLTLNGAGAASAISQNAVGVIKAAGLELLGANATHTLANTGNDIKKLAGNTKTVSLTNNAAFAIDTVNTVGLTTSGNTTLSSTGVVTQTQAISATGLELLGTGGNYTLNNANNTVQKLAGNTGTVSLTNKGDLEIGTVNTNGLTAAGNVSITTTAGSTLGNLTLKQNVTGANVNLNAAGSVLRDGNAIAAATSLLRIKAGGSIGTSASRIKTEVATFSMESAGDQYVTETNAVTVAAKSTKGSVNIDATTGALTVGSSTLIDGTTVISGISAATGVVLTAQADDLNINQGISNATAGDVVLGAGVSKRAGDGAGGDVQTTAGMAVNNVNGNTYVYTGSASGAGLLSNLDNGFSDLRLSGDTGTTTSLAQNADSYVKYTPGQTITDGAKAQVMFREKITLDTSSITGAALDKTYADANTTSSIADKAALFAQMQAKLKQVNFGEIITRASGGTNGKNTFKISKAALISDLTGALSSPVYSRSDHLTAATHNYGALTSGKYDASLDANKAQVVVAKLALTGSISQGNSTYGDSLVAGTASFTNKVGSDVVNPASVNIATAGNTSGSGNLNAGTYVGIQSVKDVTGADAANYSFTNVKGDYKVDQRQLTIAPGSVATKTADGTTAAAVTPGALSNLVGNETLGVAATGTFSDANAGNNKAVNAFYTLQNGANGGLASNYILALGKPGNPDTRMTGTILAAVNPVTPIAPVNNNTGSVSRVRTVSGFGGVGAATGVLDDKAVTESREVCSDVFPENCECQPSVIPSIEICFAPKSVAATKEEK